MFAAERTYGGFISPKKYDESLLHLITILKDWY